MRVDNSKGKYRKVTVAVIKANHTWEEHSFDLFTMSTDEGESLAELAVLQRIRVPIEGMGMAGFKRPDDVLAVVAVKIDHLYPSDDKSNILGHPEYKGA